MKEGIICIGVPSSCTEDDIIDGDEDKLDDVPDEADH